MSKAFLNKRFSLLVPVLITSFTIVTLAVMSQVLIDNNLNYLKKNETALQIANNEKMLSQEIVKAIAADNLKGEEIGFDLDSAIHSFEHLHNALIDNVTRNRKEEADNTRLVNPHYFELDTAYKNLTLLLDSTNSDEMNIAELIKKQESYLDEMSVLIEAVTQHSNYAVTDFKKQELLIRGISILLVFIEVGFIFIPAVVKIQKQNKVFRTICFNQSHIVRRPLANLKAILLLINDTNPNETDARRLVELAFAEADKLDSVIRENVLLGNDVDN